MPHSPSASHLLPRCALFIAVTVDPRIGMVDGPRQHKVPAEVLCEYVIHLVEEAGGTVGSRHLGRELARIVPREDGTTALAVIKEVRWWDMIAS